MRKILAMTLATLATLMAIVPAVMPTTNSGTATASVTVGTSCDVAATGPVSFGSLAPAGSTTSSTTVSEPTGNFVVAPEISGSGWTGVTLTNTMPVGQTSWALSPSTPTNALTGSGVSIVGTIAHGSNQVVNLGLSVPPGQPADSYTQTITFSVSC